MHVTTMHLKEETTSFEVRNKFIRITYILSVAVIAVDEEYSSENKVEANVDHPAVSVLGHVGQDCR